MTTAEARGNNELASSSDFAAAANQCAPNTSESTTLGVEGPGRIASDTGLQSARQLPVSVNCKQAVVDLLLVE